MIDFSIMGKLFNKEVEIDGEVRPVYGLASLRTGPRPVGLGRLALGWVKEKARNDGKYCVICFTLPKTLGFYSRCGWHENGMYEGMFIVTSIPVGRIAVNERW